MRVRVIEPAEVTKEERKLLEKGCELDLLGTIDVDELFEMANACECQIWRFEVTGGGGVVVTQRHTQELFVWMMVGRGFIKNIDWLIGCLSKAALSAGCTRLRSVSIPGMQRVLKSRGFKTDAFVLSKEINGEQQVSPPKD